MAASWTYSDWITYESGNALRLSRLRLHIREVADAISTGNFLIEGKTHSKDLLEKYLQSLLDIEQTEAATGAASSSSGNRSFFTRGKMQ